jgi:hypothetical protein
MTDKIIELSPEELGLVAAGLISAPSGTKDSEQNNGGGRPYLVAGKALTAKPGRRADWGAIDIKLAA